MYDMYPELGPRQPPPREPAQPRGRRSTSLDLRDNGGQRPDDN